MQPKDLVAVGARPTHGGSVVVRGPLTKLCDGKLDVGLALGNAVVGSHESRTRTTAYVIGGFQQAAGSASTTCDDHDAADHDGSHDDEQRHAARDKPRCD